MPKDTHSTLPADAELVLPEQATVALAELAGAAREGLLALAVGTGLGVLRSLLDADVDRLAGAKGRHNPARAAVRHGSQPGKVTLGGRRVRVDRPRVRSADGTQELPLATWQAFAGTELLDQLALERMLAKLSTRRYQHGLEPVGSQLAQASSGTSKSAVSRRFVAATEHAWPSYSPRICPPSTWWRCWWMASGRPSTPAWSRWGSPWTGPRSPRPGRGSDRERHRGA
jgi:putative transposase